jgi:hypothetical protein
LILSNRGLILTNRAWLRPMSETLLIPNAASWWVVGGALVFLLLALYTSFARDLFRFGTLYPEDVVVIGVAAVFSLIWFEILKLVSRGEKLSKPGGGDKHACI